MRIRKLVEEKASMSLYAIVVLTGFILIVSSVYFASLSIRKIQLTTVMKIKQSYETDNAKVEEIYQNHRLKI